jgi:hypothetical protein
MHGAVSAARDQSRPHFRAISRTEQPHEIGWWLFDQFQHRVEALRRHPVGFVDTDHPPSPPERRMASNIQNFLDAFL